MEDKENIEDDIGEEKENGESSESMDEFDDDDEEVESDGSNDSSELSIKVPRSAFLLLYDRCKLGEH